MLGWPGYRVYRQEIDEAGRKLKVWVRRKRGNRRLVCSACGRRVDKIHQTYEREVRDLRCFEFETTVVIEVHRICCPDCGVKAEKVDQLPSKAPYSRRFEDEVGAACESAAARQVARRMGMAESTVRAIDLRYLERWMAKRRQAPLRHMGVDEIYRGKSDKFLTVVSNLETGEPLWFGKERKKETLDEFLRTELRSGQRKRIEAACVDMWEPFRLSIEQWAPQCRIVYDKFHIIQHANDAVDEVRRAEFFRKGPKMRDLIKGKKWLLMSRWKNLTAAAARRAERTVPTQPASLQGLPPQRKSGKALGLPLRGGDGELSEEVDRSAPLAAPALVSEACQYPAGPSRRDSEPLQNQGPVRSRRSDQRKYPYAHQSRPGL